MIGICCAPTRYCRRARKIRLQNTPNHNNKPVCVVKVCKNNNIENNKVTRIHTIRKHCIISKHHYK